MVTYTNQKEAEAARDKHRLAKIKAGRIKYNPKIHKGKAFEELKGA